MKKILAFSFAISFVFVGVALGFSSASASSIPSFSAFYSGNGDYVEINITNADANASILLDDNSSLQSLGTTNSSGAFSVTISTAQYNITPGSVVSVSVDGAASNSLEWPYTTTSGSTFTLNQTSLTVPVGQSSAITASNAGPFYLSSNSNPTVANVSISGDAITVVGNVSGTTNITICAVSNSSACATATISVSGSSGTGLSFSQNNISIPFGNSATVSISGGTGVYSITNNSNPSSLQVGMNGSVLSLYGEDVSGSSAVTICSTSGNYCGVVTVTVGSTSSNSSLIFSQTNPSLSVGQSLTVSVIGGVAPYYISSNSNSGVVSASVSNNVITFAGLVDGIATVDVCSETNVCSTLTVTVGGSSTSGTIAFSTSNVSLSTGQTATVGVSGASDSYYISTNSNSSVASAALNGANVNVTALAAGTTNIGVCASSGSCGTIYVTVQNTNTVTSASALTLTQVIAVGQLEGIIISGGSSYSLSPTSNAIFSATINDGDVLTLVGLTVGNSSVNVCSSTGSCVVVYVDVTAATTQSASSATPATNSSAGYQFTTLLTYGSTGAAVTALQELLTTAGIYSGPITGYYGDLTTSAVEAFQSQHGISSVGYVGPGTRAALNAEE